MDCTDFKKNIDKSRFTSHKKMNILAVGDVHGCYQTFKKLLDENWNREEELLVQVGDLIDRGNFAPQVVEFARELQEKYGAVFLKGNHEGEAIKNFRRSENPNWVRQGGAGTIAQYELLKRDIDGDVSWFEEMPLFWENEHIFISHAGISLICDEPLNVNHVQGILWNRSPLKNLGKLQIIGHTPLDEGKPKYMALSNSWNIDTAAVYGVCLTALLLSESGEVLKSFSVKTDARDIEK